MQPSKNIQSSWQSAMPGKQQGDKLRAENLYPRESSDTLNQIPASPHTNHIKPGFFSNCVTTIKPHLPATKLSYAAVVEKNLPDEPNMDKGNFKELSIPGREMAGKDKATRSTSNIQVDFSSRWIGLGRGKRKIINATEVGCKPANQPEILMLQPGINPGDTFTKPAQNTPGPQEKTRGIVIAKNTETTVVGRITEPQSDELKPIEYYQPAKAKNKIHSTKQTYENVADYKKNSLCKNSINKAIATLKAALIAIPEFPAHHRITALERVPPLMDMTKKVIETGNIEQIPYLEILTADYYNQLSKASNSMDEKAKYHKQAIDHSKILTNAFLESLHLDWRTYADSLISEIQEQSSQLITKPEEKLKEKINPPVAKASLYTLKGRLLTTPTNE